MTSIGQLPPADDRSAIAFHPQSGFSRLCSCAFNYSDPILNGLCCLVRLRDRIPPALNHFHFMVILTWINVAEKTLTVHWSQWQRLSPCRKPDQNTLGQGPPKRGDGFAMDANPMQRPGEQS